MAQASQVFRAALGRTRSGSRFVSTVGSNRSTIRQSNRDRKSGGGLENASGPNTHMVSGGASGIPQFPNSVSRGRTWTTPN